MTLSSRTKIYGRSLRHPREPTRRASGESNTGIYADNRLKVQAIQRFTSTATAVEDLTAVQEGRLTDTFAKFLTEATGGASDGEKKKKKKLEETLIVAEAKLGM